MIHQTQYKTCDEANAALIDWIRRTAIRGVDLSRFLVLYSIDDLIVTIASRESALAAVSWLGETLAAELAAFAGPDDLLIVKFSADDVESIVYRPIRERFTLRGEQSYGPS